jgi:hypothetical protein
MIREQTLHELKAAIAEQNRMQATALGLIERIAQAKADAATKAEKDVLRRKAVDRTGKRFMDLQQKFDDALSDAFHVRAPQPRADEELDDYHRRLFRLARKYVSPNSDIANVRVDGLDDAVVLNNMSDMLLKELHRSKRDPRTVDDASGFRVIEKTDDIGRVCSREFIGNTSFVLDPRLGHRQGRRVVNFTKSLVPVYR